jgi:hypothetical protein
VAADEEKLVRSQVISEQLDRRFRIHGIAIQLQQRFPSLRNHGFLCREQWRRGE